MAEGLILQGEENQQTKDLGHEYFQELRCRSLLQQSSEDTSRFFMHDLINDLAQWAAGDMSFRLQCKLNDDKQYKGSKNARHSSYFRGKYDNHKRFEEYYSVESLRTFLPLQRNPNLGQGYLTTKALDLLPKLRCPRVLCLSGYYIRYLPESIGDLKHLSRRDASGNDVTEKSLSKFDNSRDETVVSDLDNCERCISLPPLGQLPSHKDLCIRRLFAVKALGPEFFGEAVLEPFPALETLQFEGMPEWKDWRFSSDVANTEFPRLRRLTINNCPKLSIKLPSYLPSLEKLVIYQCEQLVVSIPSLPMLNELMIEGCKEVVQTSTVDFSMLDLMQLSNISKLTCLTEGFMKGLTKLFATHFLSGRGGSKQGATTRDPFQCRMFDFASLCKVCEVAKKFPSLACLRELYITGYQGCVLFRESILPSSLKTLAIKDCFDLQCVLDEEENVNIRNTCLLEELTIKSCPFLTCLSARGELPVTLQYLKISLCTALETVTSQGKLPSALKHLEISSCTKLESIAKRFQEGSSLEYISLWDCENLKSLPERHNLKIFYIGSVWTFVSFPEGGFPAVNLRLLWISSCNKLEALPNCFHKLTSLQRLVIGGCLSIISFPQEGLPPNLTSLQITGHKICKPLSEWGLHKLASLEGLNIFGCQHV
ncbi:hypothetical protein CRYUN_Cryun05aG0141600 [Craigia yunnanensis]